LELDPFQAETVPLCARRQRRRRFETDGRQVDHQVLNVSGIRAPDGGHHTDPHALRHPRHRFGTESWRRCEHKPDTGWSGLAAAPATDAGEFETAQALSRPAARLTVRILPAAQRS
jgi:hypothetical protein